MMPALLDPLTVAALAVGLATAAGFLLVAAAVVGPGGRRRLARRVGAVTGPKRGAARGDKGVRSLSMRGNIRQMDQVATRRMPRRELLGLRLGRDLESLLWDIGKRMDAPEFRFFIIALSVQRETGGNLAETLSNLSDVLRRRRTMRAKARAMASEARASTMILGSLPFIVTIILMTTSPGYIMPLFGDIRGLALIGLALFMLATGIGIMVRMAKFEI